MKVKPKKKSCEEIADPRNAIYHFKIYLLNLSPMIYRRFKIKGDTHIAQHHLLIQIIMGWDNDHLQSFKVWGMEYGISRSGGLDFHDDPCKIFIVDFGFKVGDKFTYTYDFGDHWQHEIRVEKIEEANLSYNHPSSVEVKRACPPEDCGVTFSYEDVILDQSIWLREALWGILESVNAGKLPDFDFYDDRIPYWYKKFDPERLDKAKINRAIKKMYQEKGSDHFWVVITIWAKAKLSLVINWLSTIYKKMSHQTFILYYNKNYLKNSSQISFFSSHKSKSHVFLLILSLRDMIV